MIRRWFSFFAIQIVLGALPVSAATYFMDAALGDDNAAGTSSAKAWKTLAKANGAKLQAGDSLLFKAGGMWNGQLNPKGSGAKGNPIVIDTYGGLDKALINGNGIIGEAVLYLKGQSDWDIGGLEITNHASGKGDRRGVWIVGPAARVRIHDLFVHDISGIPATPDIGDDGQAAHDAKATGGMAFTGGGQDLLIENCEIKTVDNTGLFTDGDGARNYTGLHIRNNVIHDVAKNAMIIRGADAKSVIEYNICYQTCVRGVTTGNTIFSSDCQGTTFQYNEGYANNSTGGHDGSLYDCDLYGGSDTKWQYSYSHDNNHGLIWFCTMAGDTGIKVRYNISQNDRGRIFNFAYDLGHADIYNNTVYIGPEQSPIIIYEEGKTYGYSFSNNIIYNLGGGSTYRFGNATRQFGYNVFYGKHPANEPADAHKDTTDPMFVAPGSGALGIHSVLGYRLRTGSPAINSGMGIADNGGRDYAGNALYQTPDRGAFEWQPGISIRDPRASENGGREGKSMRGPENGSALFFEARKVGVFDALGRPWRPEF